MSDPVILDTSYQIVSPNSEANSDSNLVIDVKITRKNDALSGVTEDDILTFVRDYLATLTTDPVNITKTQTIQTSGL